MVGYKWMLWDVIESMYGGEGGIRTRLLYYPFK